jgi:hypothetical protein
MLDFFQRPYQGYIAQMAVDSNCYGKNISMNKNRVWIYRPKKKTNKILPKSRRKSLRAALAALTH